MHVHWLGVSSQPTEAGCLSNGLLLRSSTRIAEVLESSLYAHGALGAASSSGGIAPALSMPNATVPLGRQNAVQPLEHGFVWKVWRGDVRQ
jgi:hypothetical protein